MSVARSQPEQSMTIDDENRVTVAKEMLSDLQRLIEALDRRVPRLERVGEAKIASDAAALRERAVSLIQRIENATSSD
jgi:hypothetical protein